MATIYDEVYRRAHEDPEGFWAARGRGHPLGARWDRVLDASRPPYYRWFAGGVLNTCYNALDLHVDRGRGKQAALIYDSPVTGTIRAFTYFELRDAVARFAGALRGQGVEKGDRVIIYMPMVPEAVIAMLACARLGAIHSVVFGGFAPKELATRIDDAKPTVMLSASCGIEGTRVIPYKPLLDQAIAMAAHKPSRCVILQRPMERASLVPGRDVDWDEAVAAASPVECVPVAATDPLYILYTSGTTGIPKGVVRDNGGHAVALKWSMERGLRHGRGRDVLGRFRHRLGGRPLLHRLRAAAQRLHHDPLRGQAGGHARPRGVLARLRPARRERALHRAHRVPRDQEGRPAGQPTWPSTTSRASARSSSPASAAIPTRCSGRARSSRCPVVDHWWQTETGWPMAANCVGLGMLPVKPGSPTKVVPGYDMRVLGEDNREVPAGQIGSHRGEAADAAEQPAHPLAQRRGVRAAPT